MGGGGGGGSCSFEKNVVKRLKETSTIGTEEGSSFTSIGTSTVQQTGEILVHQKQYVANIEPLELGTSDNTRKLTQKRTKRIKSTG